MTAVLAVRPATAVREPFAFLKRVTFALNAWLALAGGAADADELRDWLHMTGMLASNPARRAVPAEKHCPRCDADKAASEWHRNAASPDGLASCCKSCRSGYVSGKDRLEKRRERYRAARKGRVPKPDMRLRENRPGARAPGEPWTLSVLLPPELHARLAEEAAAEGVSMSAVVRDVLAGRYAAGAGEAW